MGERSKKDGTNPQIFLSCGAEGAHEAEGRVVGCCYQCGLLLCAAHVFHLPRTRRFGKVDGVEVHPLVCGTHAGPFGLPGLPPPPEAPKPPRRSLLSLLRRQPAAPRRRSGRRV